MSETEILGRFETTMDNMQKMISWSSAPFDETYNQVYVNVASEEVRTVANAGASVTAYCTYQPPLVENISLHSEVDESAGMQSNIRAPRMQDYLEFVGGENLTVEFYGIPGGENKADHVRIIGDLTADIYVPSSDSDYESKQLGIVNLYDENENWRKSSNNEPLETSFETHTDEFEKILNVVSFDSFALSQYPVVIEDGEFVLEATDSEDRDSVHGSLNANNVEGPDVSNTYSRGFEELFSTVTGKIQVSIEQDSPISIVRQSNDEALTLRYCIIPTEG